MAAPPPFGRETVFSVHGTAFAVGTQDREEVLVFTSDGSRLAALHWEGEDRAVTEESLA